MCHLSRNSLRSRIVTLHVDSSLDAKRDKQAGAQCHAATVGKGEQMERVALKEKERKNPNAVNAFK